MNRKTKLSKMRYWLDFLLEMTKKEISARYKHALLGFLWVMLNPILQMLIIGMIFQFFIPVDIDNYFLFLFAGLLPWNFFSLSVLKMVPSIVYERTIIQKSNFPRESIGLSISLANFFHFSVSLLIFFVIYIAILITSGNFSSGSIFSVLVMLITLIPISFILLFITSSLGLYLSALNVKYRDIYFISQALFPLWFYITPIIYQTSLFPEHLRKYFYLNPMTALIETYHWIFFALPPISIKFWAISIGITLLACLPALRYFVSQSKYFDDWI